MQDSPETSVGPAQAVESFEMACRQAHHAWANSSMLARTKLKRVDDVRSAFESASPREISALLADMAGSALASYALISGVDDSKAIVLGRLVIEAAAHALAKRVGALSRAELLKTVLLYWLENGCHPDAPELSRIDELTGAQPAIRLGLLAAYATPLALCLFVLNAHERAFPFVADMEVP